MQQVRGVSIQTSSKLTPRLRLRATAGAEQQVHVVVSCAGNANFGSEKLRTQIQSQVVSRLLSAPKQSTALDALVELVARSDANETL